MKMSSDNRTTACQNHTPSSITETSLFDLIAAISDEVGPEDDGLVTATVVHLMNSGRLRFSDDPRPIEVI